MRTRERLLLVALVAVSIGAIAYGMGETGATGTSTGSDPVARFLSDPCHDLTPPRREPMAAIDAATFISEAAPAPDRLPESPR